MVRDNKKIITAYTPWWDKEKRIKIMFEPTRMEKNGYLLVLPKFEYEKGMILKLAQHIEGKNILEMGSGDGLNLLCLSILRPGIKWTGLEFTEAGVKRANAYLKNPPQEVIKAITGKEFKDPGNITYIQGDMRRTGFPDNSFDMVFTKQAIEQLPKDYLLAFGEAYRLAPKSIFIEEFRDYQKFRHLRYLKKSDYFRWPAKEVEKVGCRIERLEPIELHKDLYELGFLVAKNDRS
jgi:ubiquinone/menaquinone biosynthesis C-methylase UbiE